MSLLPYTQIDEAPRSLEEVFPPGSVFDLVGNCRDVVAMDFTTGEMMIRDSVTPAKDYLGPLSGKMTITGGLTPTANGAYFDNTHYASFPLASWGYDPTEMTVFIEWMPNFNGNPADNRQLVFIDNDGNDRFDFYYPTGSPVRFVYGTGAAVNTLASPTVTAIGVPYKAVFGASPRGGRLYVGETSSASTPSTAMAAATPTNMWIGTGGGGLSPANSWIKSIVMVPRDMLAFDLTSPGSDPMVMKNRTGRPFADSGKDRVLALLGDSHTFSGEFTTNHFWPHRLAGLLGSIYYPLNHGNSGATTANMMGRRTRLRDLGTPYGVIIEGGTNDLGRATTVAASPTPTSTAFKVASNDSFYSIGGWIRVAGELAQIQTVDYATDIITLTGALAGGAPAAGAAVTIDTAANLGALVDYCVSIGVSRIAIMGYHYLNFSTGGDTASAQNAAASALRTIQQGVATAKSVLYIDTYTWMRGLILDGEYTQADHLWHVADADQHLSAAGQAILADATAAAIRDADWL